MAPVWQTVGFVLAAELLFAIGMAVLTRVVSTSHVKGQTYALVVLGVAGVVSIMGLVIGWQNVGWLALGFSVAAIPMAIEYYTRINTEQKREDEEQDALLQAIERKAGYGNSGADREKRVECGHCEGTRRNDTGAPGTAQSDA